MTIFSTENRTRRYENRHRYDRSKTFADPFDRELPPEARAELRQKPASPPPPRVAPPPPPAKRESPLPAKREWRGPAIIGVVILLALLYALSRQRVPSLNSSSTPVPESRSVSALPPPSQPVQVRRAEPVWTEVRRALPAIPRAQLVTSRVSSPVANWQRIKFPDGQIVQAAYQGALPNSSNLPSQGFIGEEWSIDNTPWIWTIRPGASIASWVDP